MDQNTYAQKLAYFDWLLNESDSYTHAVTLTLKQKRSLLTEYGLHFETLTPIEAQKTFRLFLNRLNQNLFGNAAKRHAKTVFVLPVLEGDGKSKLLHYHCALGNFPAWVPNDELPKVIACAWQQTPFGNTHVHVQPIRSAGWGAYMGKDIGSRNTEGVDLLNLRLPTTSQT